MTILETVLAQARAGSPDEPITLGKAALLAALTEAEARGRAAGIEAAAQVVDGAAIRMRTERPMAASALAHVATAIRVLT